MRDYKKQVGKTNKEELCSSSKKTQAANSKSSPIEFTVYHSTWNISLLRMTLWTGSRQYSQIRQSLTKHTRCKLHNIFITVAQVFLIY